MSRCPLSRAASAAFPLILMSGEPHSAAAQEALPTIEVGAASRDRATGTTAPRFLLEPKTAAEGYVVRNATTGTKTEIPIRETPSAIAVVPKQILQDQQITRVQDALENVSGVQSNNNDLEGYIFYLRGFRSLYTYRNALAVPGNGANPGITDTANVERIEVLKGPGSALYGRTEPGGLINVVTKQPLAEPRFVVEQQIGSYDHYRTQWDFSTPIASVPGLAARVSGAYQNNGSFRKFQGGERVLVAPVISYRPTDWTEFTLDTQFFTNRAQSDVGQPSLGPYGRLPGPLPNDRSFQEANDPRDHNTSYLINYNFSQQLDENWKFTNRFLYSETWNTKPILSLLAVQDDNMTLGRMGQYQDLHGRTFSTNLDMNGKFDALGAKHNFLFGLDYFNSYYDYYFANGYNTYPINIYAPIYGTVPPSDYLDTRIGSGFKYHSSILTRQKGLYVQEHATWFDTLHLQAGVRYDIADLTEGTADSFPDENGVPNYSATKNLAIANRLSRPTEINKGWTPRVGVVYDLTPELSAYANYSRSFGVSNGFDTNNRALPPQRGLQWEFGFKAQILENLSATLAFYQITKSGLSRSDLSDFGAVQLAGLQRSRGVELDVIGRVTDRLSIIADYAHIDAKVISDSLKDPLAPFDSGLYGNHLVFAPRHSGKLSFVYDLGDNGLGWRIGGSVTAQTASWGDIENTFVLPSWARLDGFASFTTLVDGHKLTAQLNLRNINNARYFESVDNVFNFNVRPYMIVPARPFTATGTLRFEW